MNLGNFLAIVLAFKTLRYNILDKTLVFVITLIKIYCIYFFIIDLLLSTLTNL